MTFVHVKSRNVDSDANLPLWRKKRYIVVLMAFFGYFNVYTLRVNLSVAIVAMTEPQNITFTNGTMSQKQDFDWNSKEIGVVLGSFFYGYIWTQVPGGVIASKFGGHIVSFNRDTGSVLIVCLF